MTDRINLMQTLAINNTQHVSFERLNRAVRGLTDPVAHPNMPPGRLDNSVEYNGIDTDGTTFIATAYFGTTPDISKAILMVKMNISRMEGDYTSTLKVDFGEKDAGEVAFHMTTLNAQDTAGPFSGYINTSELKNNDNAVKFPSINQLKTNRNPTELEIKVYEASQETLGKYLFLEGQLQVEDFPIAKG